MKEYAFDIKMFAVVRVKAASLREATDFLRVSLDAADLNVHMRSQDGSLVITEASISVDDCEFPYLFEIDGEPVDPDGDEPAS